jgi:tetratricopeptide (TPR) repeat protein
MLLPADRLTDYISTPAQMVRIAKPAHGILRLNQSLESNPLQVHLLKERAAEYYRLQNYEQAIADYSSSLAIQPDDVRTLHLRGATYEQTEQFDRARADYQHAITIQPELADEYIERGTALGQMGNLRQSIASFTEGIRLAPQNSNGYFNRGISYLQLGDFERATEDFSEVIQLAPHDETAYYWRGIANEEAGRQFEAAADYQQVLARTNNPDVRVEIEQKLNQWHANSQDSQSILPIEKQNTSPFGSEKPKKHLDLYDLLLALGEHARHSTWYVSNVECYGEKAEELYAYTNGNRPMVGEDFLRIASGLHQTIQGDFLAFNRETTSYWIFIRAWDGTGFYVETDELQSWERLRTRFQSAEEMEGVAAP